MRTALKMMSDVARGGASETPVIERPPTKLKAVRIRWILLKILHRISLL